MSKEYYTNFHEDNTSMDSNDMSVSSNKQLPMVVKKQNGKVCVVVSDDMINSTDDLAGLIKALKSKHEPSVESTVDIDAVDYPHDGNSYNNIISTSHQNVSSKIKFHNYKVPQKYNYKNEDEKFIEDAMHYSENQKFSDNKYQIKYLSTNSTDTVKRGRGRPPKVNKNEKLYDYIDEDIEADDDSKLNSTIEKYLTWDSIQSRIKYSIKSPLQSINQTIHTTTSNNIDNDSYYHHHQVSNSEIPVKVVTSPFKYSTSSSTHPTDSTNQSISKIIKPVTIKFPYANSSNNNNQHQIPIKSVPSIIQLKTNDLNSNLPQKRLIMTKSNTSNDNNTNTVTKLSLISNSSGFKVAAYRLSQMKPQLTPQSSSPPQLDDSVDEPPSSDNIDSRMIKRGRGRPRKYPIVSSNKKHIHNVTNTNSMREKDLLDIEFEKPKSPTIHIPPYSKRGRKRKLSIDRNNVQNIRFLTSENLDINPIVKKEQVERYPDFIKNEVVDDVSYDIPTRSSHSMSKIFIDKPEGSSETERNDEEEENMTKYKRKETPTSSKRKLFEEISKKIIQNQVPNNDNKETKDKPATPNYEENNDDEDEEDVCLTVVEEEEPVEKIDNRFDSRHQLNEEIEQCEHDEVEEGDDDDYEEEGNYDKEDSREVLRRAEHNMVERRRRDRINGYIAELHKILPRPQRNRVGHSKGAILKAVFDHYRNQCDTYRLLKEKCRTLVDKCLDKDNRIEQLEKDKSSLCKKLNFINETVTATLFKTQEPN